jgi:hypothetical protein
VEWVATQICRFDLLEQQALSSRVQAIEDTNPGGRFASVAFVQEIALCHPTDQA